MNGSAGFFAVSRATNLRYLAKTWYGRLPDHGVAGEQGRRGRRPERAASHPRRVHVTLSGTFLSPDRLRRGDATLPGTLDLLILKAVSLAPAHGYGILLRIGQISGGALAIEQGALYPALARLERRRLLEAKWGTSERQPGGALLPADGRWQEAASRRDCRLAAAGRGHDGRADGHARGGMRCDGSPG